MLLVELLKSVWLIMRLEDWGLIWFGMTSASFVFAIRLMKYL
jgi:hypothetical protein